MSVVRRVCPECGHGYWEHEQSAAETIAHLNSEHPGWRDQDHTNRRSD